MSRTLRQLARAAVIAAGTAGLVVVATGRAAAAAQDPTAELIGVIERARNWLMSIAFVAAVFFATWGALRRMGAGDNPGEVEKSNSLFRGAFVGLGLAVLAPILVAIAKSILEG